MTHYLYETQKEQDLHPCMYPNKSHNVSWFGFRIFFLALIQDKKKKEEDSVSNKNIA
jgi:hypothetical protein